PRARAGVLPLRRARELAPPAAAGGDGRTGAGHPRHRGAGPQPAPLPVVTIVDRASKLLAARTSRRGFLARTAVVASALAVAPRRYLFEPLSADDAICGAENTCGSGWTVMCCTINNGVNGCPPGSFAAAW